MKGFTRKKLEKVPLAALVISRVFDPILLIFVTLILTVWTQLVNGERLRFLFFLIFVDGILPAFVLFYFIQRGKILSGWDVKTRQERVPLFVFVVLAHFVSVMLAFWLGKHPLAEYLVSFWILTVTYAMVTCFWKISVHCGVISTLVTFLVLTNGVEFSWGYLFVLLVIWARVVGRYHRLSQALMGAATPLVILPLSFWWYGLL